MTTDPFATAARALGADPAEVRESMRNAAEHAERNGMPDEEFALWIWHAGAVWARGMEAARAAQEPTDAALTDAEWREFQSIPDQGYSHRAWVDQKITERLSAARAARRDEEQR